MRTSSRSRNMPAPVGVRALGAIILQGFFGFNSGIQGLRRRFSGLGVNGLSRALKLLSCFWANSYGACKGPRVRGCMACFCTPKSFGAHDVMGLMTVTTFGGQ